MDIELIEELKTTKNELKKLQARFNTLYHRNEERQEEITRLKRENVSLKNKNYELTILIDTFLKLKK